MSDKQYEIWALELSNYFIKKQKYQLITFNQETSEMWLFNPKEKRYPVILITTKPISTLNQLEVEHHRMALAMLVKSEPKGLNFSVYPELKGYSENNIVVMEDRISNPSLLEYFKDLDDVLKPSQNLKSSRKKAMIKVEKNMRRLNKWNRMLSYKMTSIISLVIISTFIFSMWFMNHAGVSLEVGLVMLGAYYKPFLVNANEWWRLLTPMLLHASFLHLIMNVLALRNLASILEKELGGWRFLMTIILGVIYGSVFIFIRDEMVIGIGVSAGVYALMGVLIVNLYERNLLKNRLVLSNILSTLFLNLMISMLPGVSFTAHLGGLYLGIFLGFIFSKRDDWKLFRNVSTAVLGVSTAFLIYLMIIKSIAFEPSLMEVEVVNRWYQLGFHRYALRLRHLFFGGIL